MQTEFLLPDTPGGAGDLLGLSDQEGLAPSPYCVW